MSNLSELITNLNEAGHTDLNIFGSAIGTIADFSGGIGAISTAIGLVKSIVSPDQTSTLLKEIRDELKEGFTRLGLDDKADELLREWDNTDGITRDAEGIYLTLPGTITAQVGTGEIVRQITVCATAVNGLSFTVHPTQWLVAHHTQVYFSHLGDTMYTPGGASSLVFTFSPGRADPLTPSTPGEFTCQGLTFTDTFDPGPDSDGDVFSYTYTLPAYLKVVMIFLATAAALDPDYTKPEHYANVIRLAAKDLSALHDKIKAGIVNLTAPDAESMIIPFPFSRFDLPDVDLGYNQQRQTGVYGNTWWVFGWGGVLVTTLSQPFGAVNLYSGYHSIRGYPLLDIPPGVFPSATSFETVPPEPGTAFFIRPVSKYLLCSLARSKDVYRGIGLPILRQIINRLKSLVGDPLLSDPGFGDWSLREVFAVLGFPRNPFITSPLSVASLGNYLAACTPFFEAPRRPISLRTLIEDLPSVPFSE